MSKLSNPSNKYDLFSVAQYYSYLGLAKKFDLLPTEKYYIINILRDGNTTKAASIDGVSIKFLKDGVDVLEEPLRDKPITDICNLSISLNKFRSPFKLAKNETVFRKGRKTIVSSYQPISLLPILSEVIEKRVYKQTTKLLNYIILNSNF